MDVCHHGLSSCSVAHTCAIARGAKPPFGAADPVAEYFSIATMAMAMAIASHTHGLELVSSTIILASRAHAAVACLASFYNNTSYTLYNTDHELECRRIYAYDRESCNTRVLQALLSLKFTTMRFLKAKPLSGHAQHRSGQRSVHFPVHDVCARVAPFTL